MMYFVLANLYLCVFYGFYYLFLRGETFFQGNRIYLLTGLLLAFTLPLAEYAGFDDSVVYLYQLPIIELGGSASEPLAGEVGMAKSPTSATSYISILYAVGCSIATLYVLLQAFGTVRALRRGRAGEAFSFFGMIRIDRTAYGSHQIAHHEQVHARQWHSADIVVMQVVKIFNWFNPVVYLYERALRLQHEYIADGRTAADDQFAYAELLVSRAMGASGPALVNSFSNSNLLKRRIAMLLRDKSPNGHGWRYAALLPVVAGMLVFSLACNHQGKAGGETDSTETLSSTAGTVDAKAFKKALGMHVMYREEAIRNGTQGILAFTFEKTDGGAIENISFLNELGDGQEEEVRKALQLDPVRHAAPMGKSMVYIHFRLSNTDPVDVSPPPAPNGYNALGEIVIMGYQPPPPPMVEPAPQKNGDAKAASGKKQFPEPTVVQVRVGEKEQDEESKDLIFQSVEIDPKPQGGMGAFMKYIGENYDYPQEAIEEGVKGIVQVSFVVEKDGSLTDMKIVRDLGYGTGDAAIRVLQRSSKWSPGVQNGRPVRVAYTLPIRLNLQQ
ncbi:M56 family metallopeptidase [Parapedobacter sp. 10938]|uniref:M56 family metallopeptidase n=1 Tax=Parapedobacter flavus TaxID=3110225 RepID=UPI002DBF6813|nr:M56 family metallopeptidase [Parapedobacter sp. 10938]MEC3878331.1 M56 family metallopeptidase [Parapedobacter sp. 10938]